jgi:hypothetical protein
MGKPTHLRESSTSNKSMHKKRLITKQVWLIGSDQNATIFSAASMPNIYNLPFQTLG